jgi:hypothetical protein
MSRDTGNIEKLTLDNKNYRKVILTTKKYAISVNEFKTIRRNRKRIT